MAPRKQCCRRLPDSKTNWLAWRHPIGGVILPFAEAGVKLLGPLVNGISAFIQPLIPTIQHVVEVMGGIFQSGMSFLGSVIQPAWQGFTTFLGTAFDGFLGYLESALPTALSVLGQFIDTALAFGQMLWQGLEVVFTSIANVVGLSSNTSSKAMSGMANVMAEAGADIQAVMLVLEFGFSHWQDVAALGFVTVMYQAVKLWNEIEYGGEVVGQFLYWFGSNWFNIFHDAANAVATMATNIWKNIESLWTAIVGLFQGKGFDFKPTKLLEGFKSTLSEMPKIAERVAGGTETALGQQMQGLSDKLNTSFASFIDTRTAQNIAAAQKLHDATKGIFDKLKHPEMPKIPALAMAGTGLNVGAADLSSAGTRRRRCQGRRAR